MCPKPSAASAGSHWSPLVNPMRTCAPKPEPAAQAEDVTATTRTVNARTSRDLRRLEKGLVCTEPQNRRENRLQVGIYPESAGYVNQKPSCSRYFHTAATSNNCRDGRSF